MAPTETITSAALVRMFAENCLLPFPDQEAIRRAFRADGFVDDNSDDSLAEYRQVNRAHDLTADFRPDWVVLASGPAAASHREDLIKCSLQGQVSDPESFEAAVEQLVGPQGTLVVTDPGRHIHRPGMTLSLFAIPPWPLLVRQGASAEPIKSLSAACGDLSECWVWQPAGLSVQVDTGEIVVALD